MEALLEKQAGMITTVMVNIFNQPTTYMLCFTVRAPTYALLTGADQLDIMIKSHKQ